MKQKLRGIVSEILWDDKLLTIRLATSVEIELSYDDEVEKQVEHLMESCEVKATCEITGWKTMSYPHLGHDVMKGTLLKIKEVW